MHKPWFDDECSKILDQGGQQTAAGKDPSQINGDNLNNTRYEVSRHFRNKKRDYLKDRINDLVIKVQKEHYRPVYKNK
jgi:hypothetical protein